jgi:hypothetical protein
MVGPWRHNIATHEGIKVLEVVDDDPSLNWCNELARTRKAPSGMYVFCNHPRIKWLIAKDIEFNNRGTILSTFIQQCRPQPNYKSGRPNFLAFDRTGMLPSGRKVGISGRHRLSTTHVLFASGGAYQINPVIDESVKIPQMAGRVGVVALVRTPTTL